MRRLFFASLLCIAAMSSGPAQAEFYLRDDHGGQIQNYLTKLQYLRMSGERVHLGGDCLSACTLYLSLPRSQLSIDSDTVFGFHAAWQPVYDRIVTSPEGTRVLMQTYPQRIKNWIARHGGLKRKMIYLTASGLKNLYASQ